MNACELSKAISDGMSYVAYMEYLEKMSKRHTQHKCNKCGLYHIWKRKPAPNQPTKADKGE